MTAIGRKTDTWGSKFGFIMAAVGSSVGLGNFWRFPFTAGENGGGAFILIYLICVVLFGLPILMAEYALGRKSGRSAIDGVKFLAEQEGKSKTWMILGWVGSLAAFGILTFYMVISAWIIDFIPQAFSGSFSGFADEALQRTAQAQALDPNAVAVSVGDISGENFSASRGNSGRMLFWLGLFIALNTFILARGVKGGLEKVATYLMPVFFVLLMGVVAFAMITGDAAAAANFLLTPDFSEVTFETYLAAVGQAFFSIGVGSCLMITYGAYLSRDTNIATSSVIVAGADTLVAMIAGFAIFPIVFAFGVDPTGGAGLFFVTLPIAFGQLPGFAGGIFFILALFAAFTSSISLMEVGVSWLEDQNGLGRPKAALIVGGLLFAIGALYVYNGDLIDVVDFLTGQIMLPLGGILVCFFAGWVLSRETMASEFENPATMAAWSFACRFVVPPAVAFILIFGALQTAQTNGWILLPEVLHGLLPPPAGT